jgi:crotonobetainyl-CoA:carnitine CoA-transferase CaiB-like acyl-CoA transferase
LGEHTAEVLRELGRSDAVIEELIARQVAAQFVEE